MKKIDFTKNRKGFSTLIVVIIIGGVMLSFAAIISMDGLFSVVKSQKEVDIKKNEFLLDACTEMALFEIKSNNLYAGSNSVYLDERVCSYEVTYIDEATRHIVVNVLPLEVDMGLNIHLDSINPINIFSIEKN
jgi:hypothetical protein